MFKIDDFLTTSDFKIKHDFLNHNEDYNDLFEHKSVDVEKTAKLLKLETTVNKHGDYYDLRTLRRLLMTFLKMFVHDLNRLA